MFVPFLVLSMRTDGRPDEFLECAVTNLWTVTSRSCDEQQLEIEHIEEGGPAVLQQFSYILSR